MKRRRAVVVQANRPRLFELDLFLTRAGRLLPPPGRGRRGRLERVAGEIAQDIAGQDLNRASLGRRRGAVRQNHAARTRTVLFAGNWTVMVGVVTRTGARTVLVAGNRTVLLGTTPERLTGNSLPKRLHRNPMAPDSPTAGIARRRSKSHRVELLRFCYLSELLSSAVFELADPFLGNPEFLAELIEGLLAGACQAVAADDDLSLAVVEPR